MQKTQEIEITLLWTSPPPLNSKDNGNKENFIIDKTRRYLFLQTTNVNINMGTENT